MKIHHLAGRRRRLPVVAVAMTAAAALVLSACGSGGSSSSAGTTGVSSTTIKIGMHVPLTGPVGAAYGPVAAGARAAFDYVNAHGGVNGRKIKLIARDDGYDPTKAVAAVRQLVLQDKVFALLGSPGTATHQKVLDYVNSQKIPDTFWLSGCDCVNDVKKYPYTFGFYPTLNNEGQLLAAYIKATYPGKKVAYIGQDDDLGAGGREGVDKVYGSDLAADEKVSTTATDLTPQISAVKAAKADVVIVFANPTAVALSELAARRLNYSPTFVSSSVGSDPIALAGLIKSYAKGKQGADIINGLITDFYMPTVDKVDDPWVAAFKKIHDTYTPKSPFTYPYEAGMASAVGLAQALKLAGKDLTREKLVKAIESGKLTSPGFSPYAYSATDHLGITGTQVGVVENGGIKAVGKPVRVTSSGTVETYEEPMAAPADTGVIQ